MTTVPVKPIVALAAELGRETAKIEIATRQRCEATEALVAALRDRLVDAEHRIVELTERLGATERRLTEAETRAVRHIGADARRRIEVVADAAD